MIGKCVCDKCILTDECYFYQDVIRPVQEIVNKNPNSKISFIQTLSKALEELKCDANFRV